MKYQSSSLILKHKRIIIWCFIPGSNKKKSRCGISRCGISGLNSPSWLSSRYYCGWRFRPQTKWWAVNPQRGSRRSSSSYPRDNNNHISNVTDAEMKMKCKVANTSSLRVAGKLPYNLVSGHMHFLNISKNNPLLNKRYHNTLQNCKKLISRHKRNVHKGPIEEEKSASEQIDRELIVLNAGINEVEQIIKGLEKMMSDHSTCIGTKTCLVTLQILQKFIGLKQLTKIIKIVLNVSDGSKKRESKCKRRVQVKVCGRKQYIVCGKCEGEKEPAKPEKLPVGGVQDFQFCKKVKINLVLKMAKHALKYLLGRKKYLLEKEKKELHELYMLKIKERLKIDAVFLKCLADCLQKSERKIKIIRKKPGHLKKPVIRMTKKKSDCQKSERKKEPAPAQKCTIPCGPHI